MTESAEGSVSTMSARLVRLTPGELRESLAFHSGLAFNASDFSEVSGSTTLFGNNSYALHGSETFVQIAQVQARKAAEQMELARAVTCSPDSMQADDECFQGLIKNFASRVLRRQITGQPRPMA